MDTPDYDTVVVMHLEQLSSKQLDLNHMAWGFSLSLAFILSFFAGEHFFFHCSGDEILEVNGESLQGLTHQQAIQTFKVNCSVTPEIPAAVHKTSEKN